jgi:hypothetical protein
MQSSWVFTTRALIAPNWLLVKIVPAGGEKRGDPRRTLA